ncbi:hypothetical protein LLG95_06730 [bacterium]|nr:hypothetical protein [bacterium]
MAVLRLNPKPLSEEDARAVSADQARIETFVEHSREALKGHEESASNDTTTTAVLQARCDQTYRDLIAAIDRLGSRSQLTTDTQARAEILRLARELGTYYDHRMTISRSARIHKPKHVQICYDIGRMLMDGDKKSLLTRPYAELINLSPDARKQMLDAETPELLKRHFEDAAKMFYVLDPAAPFSLEFHDYPHPGDQPVTRATENLLHLYSLYDKRYGSLINAIDPELIAHRKAPEISSIAGELFESSAWLSRQYYESSSSWTGAYDLYKQHQRTPPLGMNLPDYCKTISLLWNRDEKLKRETSWLAEASAAAESFHSWSDLAGHTGTQPFDPDNIHGSDSVVSMLEQIQYSRLEAAAVELLQAKPVPAQASSDSFFYDCFSNKNIVINAKPIMPGKDSMYVVILTSQNIRQFGNRTNPNAGRYSMFTSFQFILPPNHPALKNIK